MTDAEAVGRAFQEQQSIRERLRTLRIKADMYAELYSQLGAALKKNPGGISLDDQAVPAGKMLVHFESKDFEGVPNLITEIRQKEERLIELMSMLR